MSTPRAPLRIGILGAARIAELAMVQPARELGHQVVAVAARRLDRAQEFARIHGVAAAYDSYQAVLDDPAVEVVYNPLVNSLHAEWNIRALRAGKVVLSEKPFAANAEQAVQIRDVARETGGRIYEGFHYSFHPVTLRLAELVRSGELGTVTSVEIDMQMQAPPDGDPRWALELGGGATMDLGCYALHALRQYGRWAGVGEPALESANGRERQGRRGVDESMAVAVTYPDGFRARAAWNMNAAERVMTWTVTGERGAVTALCWPVPHLDDRVLTRLGGVERTEQPGSHSSYWYQLRALDETLRGAGTFGPDADDAVRTMTLVDAAYRAAGFAPRG